MVEGAYRNESKPSQIAKALDECITGARIAETKAQDYLKLSESEQDDSIYEACRSMHRFYSAMHEFFLEEQQAISVLLRTEDKGTPPKLSVAA